MQYLEEVTDAAEINDIVALFSDSVFAAVELTRIQRIHNPVLSRRFEQTAGYFPEPNIRRKFHGSVDPMSIIANGFHLPTLQRGMFGPGIYFASDPEKSRHFALGNQLLLCRVALGRPLVVSGADEALNRTALFSR
eukprot:RCo002813